MNLNSLREMLIASLHSDSDARTRLDSLLGDSEALLKFCAICAPHDEYSNDCRMEAAHRISLFPAKMLGEVIPLLLVLLEIPSKDGEDMNGNIARHLIAAVSKGKTFYSGTIYQDLDSLAQRYS